MVKKILLSLCLVVMISVPVCAESYSTDFPEYVPISGGAWLEVNSDAGEMTVLVPADFLYDTFSFSGNGYNVVNVTDNTVTGVAYSSSTFDYYGSPTRVQCRFQSFDTLQLYVPYQSGMGNTSYRWMDVDIDEILNTSIRFMDDKADRQNDNYKYSTGEIIGICILVAVLVLVVIKIFSRGWKS